MTFCRFVTYDNQNLESLSPATNYYYGLLKDSFAVTKLNYRVYIFTNLSDDNRVYYNILFTI